MVENHTVVYTNRVEIHTVVYTKRVESHTVVYTKMVKNHTLQVGTPPSPAKREYPPCAAAILMQPLQLVPDRSHATIDLQQAVLAGTRPKS